MTMTRMTRTTKKTFSRHHQSTSATTNSSGGSSGMSHSRSFPMLVRSHSKSLRAVANPSAVWAHFDLCSNDPLRAQCRICGAVVVRGGANPRQCGTTNLHRHLRVHHGGRSICRRYHGNLFTCLFASPFPPKHASIG